jgi:hypothetical protein
MNKKILLFSLCVLFFLVTIMGALGVNNYVFSYQSYNNSFNMTTNCSGLISFSPTSSYPLEVCLQNSTNITVIGSCINYTSNIFGMTNNISTNNIDYTNLVSGNTYRLSFHWKRIRYDNMNNSALNYFNDTGESGYGTHSSRCYKNEISTTSCSNTVYKMNTTNVGGNYQCGESILYSSSSNCLAAKCGTAAYLFYSHSDCVSPVTSSITYIAGTDYKRIYEGQTPSGGNDASIVGCTQFYGDGGTSMLNAQSSCGCFNIGGDKRYLATGCVDGSTDFSTGLCSYAGDYSDYSSFFVFNASYLNSSSNFTNKLLTLGLVNFLSSNFSVTPSNISETKSLTEKFFLSTDISDSVNENVNFSVNIQLKNSSFFNITYNNNTIIFNNGSIYFNITSNTSIIDGVYNGNVTISRLFDGKTIIIPLSLGISTTYGKPEIRNLSNWNLIGYNNVDYSFSYNVTNVGIYNLSNCTGDIGGSFVGWSFYSFTTDKNNIVSNDSTNFIITYHNIPNGVYGGYLQVNCLATANNIVNSLNTSNRPYLTISSSSPIFITSSSGGGSSSTVVNVGSNLSGILVDGYFLTSLSDIKDVDVYKTTKDLNSILVTSCTIPDYTCGVNGDGTITISRSFGGEDLYLVKSYQSQGVLVSGGNSVRFPVKTTVINYGYPIFSIPIVYVLIVLLFFGGVYLFKKDK